MFKIGDIARMAGVTVRTLHYYEEIKLFMPTSTTESGHRLYLPRQLETLRHITDLKTLGLSLEEIHSVLKGEAFETVLGRKQRELMQTREQINEQIALIQSVLEKEVRMENYLVEIKELPAYQVLAARGKAENYKNVAAPMGKLFEVVGKALKDNQLTFRQPCVVIWHGGGYQSEEAIELEVAEAFKGEAPTHLANKKTVHLTNLPTARVASAIHRGSYEKFGEAYAAILNWMEENDYVPDGPVREVYLHFEENKNNNISELQIPIKPRG